MCEAPCAGKTFEHHVRLDLTDRQTWRCPRCKTAGTLKEMNDCLWPLVLRAEAVRERLAQIPVILMPSDSPPGLIGQFCGYDLYRVAGIGKAMIAMGGLGS